MPFLRRLFIIDFSNLLHLSFIFFYIGLFTVGGGLAAVTLMHQELVPSYIDETSFYSFVAVSESTPGPIGVNMSTYIGYNTIGVLGSVCLTLAMVLPSFITILVIARASSSFQNNVIVKRCFYGLRAASVGLIGVAIYKVFISSILTIELFKLQRSLAYILNYKAFAFFAILLTLSLTILKKLHPVFIIVLSGFFGVLFL
jgi:chromate transport protein